METHVQLYKEGVYGGWQIYSRSRGPAALAWETEAMLTCTCHCPHQSIHSTPEYPHQSIHTRETKYQSSSSSASARVVSEVTTQANLHQGPMYQYHYSGQNLQSLQCRSGNWLYILRQQIETNPLPNIDTCGATLTPFHAPLHHVNLISFY